MKAINPRYRFEIDNEAAKQRYVKIVRSFFSVELAKRISAIRNRSEARKIWLKKQDYQLSAEASEETRQELEDRILENQNEYHALLVDLKRLEKTKVLSRSDAEIAIEFGGILRYRGVKGARVNAAGQIILLVKVRFPYEGHIYNLSDWALSFDGLRMATEELDPGWKVDPGEHNGDTVYRYDGEFCFGAQKDKIRNFRSEGNFAAALSTAIYQLHKINPNDLKNVPKKFKRAEDYEG